MFNINDKIFISMMYFVFSFDINSLFIVVLIVVFKLMDDKNSLFVKLGVFGVVDEI